MRDCGDSPDLDEDRVLEAIRLEWWLAWAELPPGPRSRLRIPGFEFSRASSYWGRWYGDRRKIVLRADLVTPAGWPCVREVLRHEMAHQLTDEVFRAEEALHGPRFKEACRLLRADPRASADTPSIYQRLAAHAPGDRKTETVRKLLALAASPNPHVAEAAMLKAHELMVRYNIEPDPGGSRHYVSVCLGEPVLRTSVANDYLAGILRDFYFVETVNVSMAVVASVKRGKILEISGTADNVRMASHVFEFLRRSIREQVRARDIRLKGSQRDYAVGFLEGVQAKLKTQRTTFSVSIPGSAALMKAGDPGLKAYLKDRYPRLRSRYHGERNRDERAYRTGVEDGRKVIIHKPIESGPTSRRHALALPWKG